MNYTPSAPRVDREEDNYHEIDDDGSDSMGKLSPNTRSKDTDGTPNDTSCDSSVENFSEFRYYAVGQFSRDVLASNPSSLTEHSVDVPLNINPTIADQLVYCSGQRTAYLFEETILTASNEPLFRAA